MNTSVATSERGESRAIPHTPWPDVQPPPSRVPKPTSTPAQTTIGAQLVVIGGGERVTGEADDKRRQDQPGDEGNSPGAVSTIPAQTGRQEYR